MGRVIFIILFFSERAAHARGGGGGGAARLIFFPVQQTTSGIGHRVKQFFRVGNQCAECEKQQQQQQQPTNIKTVYQTSLLHIESNLDLLGLLSPTHDQRSQQQSGQIALQVSQGHTSYKNKEK